MVVDTGQLLQLPRAGFPHAHSQEKGHGSGYRPAPAAALGADGSGAGFPHAHSQEKGHGSGYRPDRAAALGADGTGAADGTSASHTKSSVLCGGGNT